jgi:hypothetical protein
MEKLLVMHVAAQLAHASAGNAAPGGSLPISPEISDPNVRAKNLMVWEDFRIFYHAIIKALADDNADTGWPPPDLGLGKLLSPDLLGPVVQKLLGGVLPAAVGVTPAHLPDPGK